MPVPATDPLAYEGHAIATRIQAAAGISKDTIITPFTLSLALLTPFTVALDGSKAFTTIQAAIDAAAAAAPSTDSHDIQLVLVNPGTYVEDLTIPNSVFVKGLLPAYGDLLIPSGSGQFTTVTGRHTVNLSNSGSVLENIHFESTGAAGTVMFDFGSSSNFEFVIDDCFIEGVDVGCRGSAISAGTLLLRSAKFDTGDTAVLWAGNAQVEAIACFIGASNFTFDLGANTSLEAINIINDTGVLRVGTATTSANVRTSRFDQGTAEAIELTAAGSTITVLNSTIDSSAASGNYIDGNAAGQFNAGAVALQGSAVGTGAVAKTIFPLAT